MALNALFCEQSVKYIYATNSLTRRARNADLNLPSRSAQKYTLNRVTLNRVAKTHSRTIHTRLMAETKLCHTTDQRVVNHSTYNTIFDGRCAYHMTACD